MELQIASAISALFTFGVAVSGISNRLRDRKGYRLLFITSLVITAAFAILSHKQGDTVDIFCIALLVLSLVLLIIIEIVMNKFV